MNLLEEYFWKAYLALQTNRLNDAGVFLCQGIEQIGENSLTLEQVELIWSIIPRRFSKIDLLPLIIVYFRNDFRTKECH